MRVKDRIREKLEAHFHIDLLEIINESSHHQVPETAETTILRILIVSKDFKGLSTVKRHQKVYQILSEELKGPIHAFSQKTLTPEEWEAIDSPMSPSPPCQKKAKGSVPSR